MSSTQPGKTTPAGGPATIGGVVYQVLYFLLCLTRHEVRRIDVERDETIKTALLVLEPRDGGDAHEVCASRYTVTQLKARSGGGTWSLQEVIKDVLPDLLKAVKLDAPNPVYQFITDARRGDWDQVQRFFRSLHDRDPGEDPASRLDNSNPLRVGARLSKELKTEAFWTKATYTERDLFAKIVDELGKGRARAGNAEFERTVWHLLGHFEFGLPISVTDAEKEIDLTLSKLADRLEDVPDLRRALLMRLAELARAGSTPIEIASFLRDRGLKAISTSHVATLQARAREVVQQRVRRCGFDESQHVQESFTESLVSAVNDSHIIALIGESGSGKSWHSYALAEALSRRGALVVHVETANDAKTTLDYALGVLWNTVKGHDGTLPYDRAAKRLPGPPPSRVLIVDSIENPNVARDLAYIGVEQLGIRLVVAAGAHAAEPLRSPRAGRTQAIEVPAFSPSEVDDYLIARRVAGSKSIPPDVRELLSQPMLARIYCDLAAGTGWAPRNEYELFSQYWNRRLERSPVIVPTFDLPLLRDLARALLSGAPYPWRAELVNEKVKHEGSLTRLQRSGWFVVHPTGDCALWHDRLLNWLIAETLVEDLLSGARPIDDFSRIVTSSFVGELKAGGRWMGYVAMDALWLLAQRRECDSACASVLAALEQSGHSHDLYNELMPTLGERAVAGLLTRLEQLLEEEPSYSALDIASCLARIAAPEAVAKARTLLMSESTKHHTVALQILRRQGDPVSLDRLWTLHVRVAGSPERYLEYDRRMDALDAALKLRPAWLISKLTCVKSDTACLSDLVYLLARFTDNGQAWRSLKTHLKAVVPEWKQRCLIRCMMVFRDRSEVDFIRKARNRDDDMVGDAALAALTRLAPEMAIQDLASSQLRYVALSREWHLHRLLAAKPQETQAAVRTLVAREAGRALELYTGAENEIDYQSFDDALRLLETALDHALSQKEVSANAGAVHASLSFLERVCRAELLERLRARRDTALEAKLATFLHKIGPRDNISARLSDRSAFATLEIMESDQVARIVEAGLDAVSWYGRIDAAEHAHKHADPVVLTKLRTLAEAWSGDGNDKFVAYVATHALCFLEDWEALCQLIIRGGLEISPHVFEQRRGQPPLKGAYVDDIRDRVNAGESTAGILLAAGITRDPSLIPPITMAFAGGSLCHEEVLSAAIALNVLEANDASVVAALSSHLGDPTLRDRFLGFLLAVGTPEALGAVADELSVRFDAQICGLLGRHDGWAARAAEFVWQNRVAAERSLSFGLALPLLGHIRSPEVKSYLERMAYGLGQWTFGRSYRKKAIEGLAVDDRDVAFRAAEASLRDSLCGERRAMPRVLMKLDAERATSILLEVVKAVDDESVELAIADALSTIDVQTDVVDMFASETSNVRRVACVLAARRLEPEALQEHLRQLALDADESVGSAAVSALREQIRTQGVRMLLARAVQASDKFHRWMFMDRAAEHARGRKEVPPILPSILAPLIGSVTPMEANRFNRSMNKGRQDYERGVKDRAQRKVRSK